ncbi:MAG: glycosyltransferase family 39 protein [Candidatus Daviesbacteria bacterium]|nr:glycosyltransferase family 39 protein [Candidatus Daviesbacteria bacterium]
MNPKILFILICLLFLFTRLYKIAEIPVSVYWDEASIGYNAYSIAQTGKDEWGEFLPLHFRAFGEFKLPVYIYTTAIFVKIFGLNEFSVRISAVLYSLGVVILTYLLAKKISGNVQIGLWSSFFISISPWFFIFSRTGFEVTAGLMFYLLGIYLSLNLTKNYFILLSGLSFIFSAYSYNSFRIIIPLTILVLLVFQLKIIKKGMVKWIIFSVLLLTLSIIPIYRLFVFDAGISRLQSIGSVSGLDFVKNYLSHFDPHFLFIAGDKNLRHQQGGFGQLYFLDAFLLIAGLIYMFKSKTKYKWLPLIFVLLGPIPAAITKESPHALRSLSAVPFICMIVAMGASYISRLNKNIMVFVLIAVSLSFFANYFINFLNIYPAQSAEDWQRNYKKIFTQSQEDFENQDRILISDKGGQPYIFALFYLNYDPEKFRAEVVRNSIDKWGFSTVKKFGKFEFGE